MRAALRIGRGLVFFLAIVAFSTFGAPASLTAAQETGLKDAIYVSPTWGYVIRWHSNEWTVAQEDSTGGTDSLVLTDSLGNSITFGGWSGFGGDAETCLDAIVASSQQDPSVVDFVLAEDVYGDPYEWRTPEDAYAVYQGHYLGDDGQLQETVVYTECQTLVPGEAVFLRTYTGPPDVFAQWYDDIVETLEGVFLPSSAWIPFFPDDLSWVEAGVAPLTGGFGRVNAAYVFDAAGQPQLLVGLVDEAGETRVVSFENVSDAPATVDPADVTLTVIPATDDVPDQDWPVSAVRWEDGAAAAADGTRLLTPGERATALLDFTAGDLSAFSCAEPPYLLLGYPAPDGAVVQISESALPAPLDGCFSDLAPFAASGRPVLRAPLPPGITRENVMTTDGGSLDALGRIPLARLTFEPGAAAPDDLLTGPLAAIVESGALEMQLGETVITLPAGEPLTAETGATLSVRNSGDERGVLLVLPLEPQGAWGIPLQENPPPGFSFAFLFPEQDLMRRAKAQQFVVDRVVLAPGATLEIDDGAAPAPEYTALLVESGSVTVSNAAGTGTPITAGATERLPDGALIQASADQPAELLLVAVGAAVDQGAAESPAELDTVYTSPIWGYTVHWDPDEWSIDQESSQNGTDFLTLHDEFGNIVAFMGTAGYNGNATACLESMKASVWQIPGAADYALSVNEHDEPFELREPTQAYAFYQMQLPDGAEGLEESFFYDECQTLVAGLAVLQRSYSGPAAAYWERQNEIIDTLEGLFPPASAWLAHMAPYDPTFEYGSTGSAPLRGKYASRSNATFVHDATGEPRFLVGLLDEAGDTRRVIFENVSDGPVLVEPETITLTLTSLAGTDEEEVLPLLSVEWEDGAPANAGGSRTLALGERATARLTFAAPESAIEACQDKAYTTFMYPWRNDADEERGFFGYGDLPACQP